MIGTLITFLSLLQKLSVVLALFRMGILVAAHGMGRGQKCLPSLKSVTHILQ